MRAVVLFLITVVFATPSFAALVHRTNLGLYGAMCENMASFDLPGPNNRVYADLLGTNALYFSDDRGNTWNIAISGQDVFGIASDATYIYARVNGEIWRSPGGDGLTWTPILTPATAVYTGEMIKSVQHDGVRLMLGCEDGIAYFNPTGNPADWTRHVISPPPPSGRAIWCITSRPTDPNTLLAVINELDHPLGSGNELQISVDGGVTWSAVALPPTITNAIEVVGVDPANPDDVYLAGDSAWATIYLNRSFLDPAMWTDITPGSFQSHYPQDIQFHSGLTWTTAHTYDVSTGTWTPDPLTTVGTHTNDGALAFDADDPLVVFKTSDVGIAVSENGGSTYEERNNGLEGLIAHDVDVDVVSKDVALVASKSGVAITDVFQKPPTPADWAYPVFPQGTGGEPLTACAIVQGSTQEFVVGDGGGTIHLSQDGGATWTDTYTFLAAPILDRSPVNDIDSAVGTDVLYAAVGFGEFGNEGRVVRSDDRGQTWTETTLTGVHPNTLEIVGTNLVYVGVGHEFDMPSSTNEGIYVTNNSGATWSRVATTAGPFKGLVADLAQDPVNPSIQYAAVNFSTGGGVVRFEYDGTGLTALSVTDLSVLYGGPTHGRFTAIETNDLGTEVYVAVDENVFMFDVTSSTWSLFYGGLPGEVIYALHWDRLVICTSTGFYVFGTDSSVSEWMEY
ncbi:MAG: hypothetical protein ABIH23_00010 [bacterium]